MKRQLVAANVILAFASLALGQDATTLKVYRPSTIVGRACDTAVAIDQVVVIKRLQRGQYFEVQLAPGEHKVSVLHKGLKSTIKIDLKAGETAYARIRVNQSPYHCDPSIEQTLKEDAIGEIVSFKRVAVSMSAQDSR